MISVCSVLHGNKMAGYVDVLCDSLVRHAHDVNEVIFVKTDARDDGFIKEWDHGHMICKMYAYNFCKGFSNVHNRHWYHMVAGHAFGMQQAVELATNDLVWMLDPDQFLFMSVDRYFADLMEKHQLDFVGVSHFNPHDQSYGYFPCLINCMCRRSSLPDPTWLKDKLYVWSGMRGNCEKIQPAQGKYLVAGPIPDLKDKFVHPDGMFDAGCNLWLWNEERKGRWLAFYLDYWLGCFKENFGTTQVVYPMNYNQKHYQTNFGLQEELGDKDLLYHRTRGGKEPAESYRDLYYSLFYELSEPASPLQLQ